MIDLRQGDARSVLALGRSAIGIDISEDYLALARKRLEGTTGGMRI